MKYHPDTHHRRSIRLKGYDCSQKGAYFVTICTLKGECFFEEFPRLKRIVEKQWELISSRHENVSLDEYVIMPNQLHGIIVITESASDATATTRIRTENKAGIENRAGVENRVTDQYRSTDEYRAGASPAPTVGAPLAGALWCFTVSVRK